RAQVELPQVTRRRLLGVPQDFLRSRGEIEVLGKQLNGGDDVHNLEQPARLANGEAQREFRFRFIQVVRREQIVRQRLDAQVENQSSRGALARAALKRGAHSASTADQARKRRTGGPPV